jgi:hypothetical protein
MTALLRLRFLSLRALIAAVALATCARADTIFFDNTDSPIVSGSFIAAFVSQNVRIKTDSFTPGDHLAYVDIWVTQFNVTDGKLPNLAIYQDNAGALGSLLTSAKLDAGVPNNRDPQQVRVNFDNGPALEDELFYWIGMNFDPGAIGSFAWATSLDPQMTFLAFITAGGVNYVGTNNVPHVAIVGTSAAAVPETGSTALYLVTLLAGGALYRRLRGRFFHAAA